MWGTDCVVLESEGASDVLRKWADRLDESISEAKLVDAYKMQVRPSLSFVVDRFR